MIYKEIPIRQNPYQLYLKLSGKFENSFLLESMEGKERLARFSFIGFSPAKMVECTGKKIMVDGKEKNAVEPLKVLSSEIPRKEFAFEGFAGGAVGYFSYDYVRGLERLPEKNSEPSGFPDFQFGIFEDCVIYDHRQGAVHYLSHGQDRSGEVLSASASQVEQEAFSPGKPSANIGKDEFEGMVAKAKEKIVDGEIFQVVLSRRYSLEFGGSLLPFYNYLKHSNPSPYMYFLKFGGRQIVGTSPENLVRVEGRKVESYATLAGTVPRGKTEKEDAELEKKLLSDEKERAEHLMLVDLTRNDMGRICKFGTVKVPELMEVHKYRDVQHIASHVVGELQEGKDCFDAFSAIFPAGTLTGAPKVRAMEIIEDMENMRRGPYGGAVGYFSFNGNCDFAILIRTLFARGKTAYLQAGAGLVYDSVPEREFFETENKMKALMNALGAEVQAQ